MSTSHLSHLLQADNSVKKANVIVLHDSDGRPYFGALEWLVEQEKIGSLNYLETTVVRHLLRHARNRRLGREVWLRAWRNLCFRLALPWIHDKVFVLGSAPYDVRLLWYGWLARRNKLIFHTSWPHWWSNSVPHPYGPLRSLLADFYERFFRSGRVEIVCVTLQVQQSLIGRAMPSERVQVISHAVDTSSYIPRTQDRIDNRLHILFVGRMVSEKGVVEAIELVKRTDPATFRFTFVGDGPLLDRLRSQLSDLPHAKVLGPIRDKSRLSKVFADSDVLIVPSRRTVGWEELFGIVIIEAMSCGLAVVASDHMGPKEIISHEKNGFLVADDEKLVDGFYTHLVRLAASPALRNSIAQPARTRAMDYSVESTAQRWLKVITA
jgi:glycosyltransferase involved in cell wall biosynthesis